MVVGASGEVKNLKVNKLDLKNQFPHPQLGRKAIKHSFV